MKKNNWTQTSLTLYVRDSRLTANRLKIKFDAPFRPLWPHIFLRALSQPTLVFHLTPSKQLLVPTRRQLCINGENTMVWSVSLIPRSFLGFLPLHIGAEIITSVGIFNKASGLYGILSIFTGHPISAMEWLMNLWSLVALLLFVWGLRGISQKNGFVLLIFAYIYSFDTILTYLFTLYFAGTWFKENDGMGSSSGSTNGGTGSGAENASSVTNSAHGAGVSTIPLADESSTSAPSNTESIVPSYIAENASSIADAALAAASMLVKRTTSGGNSTEVLPVNKSATLAQETSFTMVITVALMLVRLYCNLIILAYARLLVRQQNLRPNTASAQQHGPFAAKLQYYALSIAERFWTGNPFTSKTMMTQMRDEDEATARLAVKFEE